jgi:hypothetical protein
MESLKKIKEKILGKPPPNIIYPLNKIDKWIELRNKYIESGYEWIEIDLNISKKEIKKVDNKNYKKFLKMKNHEQSLKRSSNIIQIPIILPPPKPNHFERYNLLKKWNQDNFFNVSMATSELQKNYNLIPIKDYDPADIFEVYFQTISETPSAPPPVISCEFLPPYDFEI